MALSDKAKKRFIAAMARRAEAQEIIDTIERGNLPQASVIAALGSTSNLSALSVTATSIAASNFTAVDAANPTKSEIDTGINTLKSAVVTALDLKADNADVETLRTQAESRLDAIEAKVDAILAALKSADLMASS